MLRYEPKQTEHAAWSQRNVYEVHLDIVSFWALHLQKTTQMHIWSLFLVFTYCKSLILSFHIVFLEDNECIDPAWFLLSFIIVEQIYYLWGS